MQPERDRGASAPAEAGDETLVDSPTVAASPAALATTSSPPSGPLSSGTMPTEGEASAPSLGSAPSASLAVTSVAQPLETMRMQEVQRTRAFIRMAFGLAVLVAVMLAFVGGDEAAKKLLYGACGCVVVAATWLGWMLRTDRGYTMARTLIAAYACIFGAFAGVWFFGVFSPAPTILPFGLFFFSAAQSFGATLAVYLTCAAGYAALGALLMSGALADRGLVSAQSLSTLNQGVIVVVVEATLLATFLRPRDTKATLDAIEHHDAPSAALRSARRSSRKRARISAGRYERGGLGRFTDATFGSVPASAS